MGVLGVEARHPSSAGSRLAGWDDGRLDIPPGKRGRRGMSRCGQVSTTSGVRGERPTAHAIASMGTELRLSERRDSAEAVSSTRSDRTLASNGVKLVGGGRRS